MSVFSHEPELGEMLATISVRELPMKLSLSTCVSLLPRKGLWCEFMSSARMHSLSASSDLLISAPSMRVCLSLCCVSAPRSLPARSLNAMRPPMGSTSIDRIACDRDDELLAPVEPVCRMPLPALITAISRCGSSHSTRVSPMMFTFCLPSSRHRI